MDLAAKGQGICERPGERRCLRKHGELHELGAAEENNAELDRCQDS